MTAQPPDSHGIVHGTPLLRHFLCKSTPGDSQSRCHRSPPATAEIMFHPCGLSPLRWLAPSTGSRCVATRARRGSPRFVGPTPTVTQASLEDGRRRHHAPRRDSYPSKVFPRRQPATRHRAPLPSCRLRHLSPCSTPEASSDPTKAGSQTPKQRSRSTSRTLTTLSASVSRYLIKPTPKHGLHRGDCDRVHKAPRHPASSWPSSCT